MPRKKEKKVYWGSQGKYQKDYNRIEKIGLVPLSGMADSLEGEILRSIMNLYYDFYNNGCCNNRSGEWLFIKKHLNTLKIDSTKWELLQAHSRGLRANPNSDMTLVNTYENAVDKVVKYLVKQEKKAMKIATKKKEKLNSTHFTPNSEDCQSNYLPDFDNFMENEEEFELQEDEDLF